MSTASNQEMSQVLSTANFLLGSGARFAASQIKQWPDQAVARMAGAHAIEVVSRLLNHVETWPEYQCASEECRATTAMLRQQLQNLLSGGGAS